MPDTFVIQYDGGDAESHTIDMRLLGESLQGLDRLVSDLIIVGSQKRLPKKSERAPLIIKASAPEAGSFKLTATLQEAAIYLQLGWQVFGEKGAEIVGEWLKAVLQNALGKKEEAVNSVGRIAELAVRQLDSQDRTEDHRHAEVMMFATLLQQQLPRTRSAMTQAASPVGRSVSRLEVFSAPEMPKLEVTKEDAEALRAHDELEWAPISSWSLITDGFVFHNRKLDIVHPEKSGFFRADVEDAAAGRENNPYASAVQRKAMIRVQARAAYRSGNLERLVILQFDEEVT